MSNFPFNASNVFHAELNPPKPDANGLGGPFCSNSLLIKLCKVPFSSFNGTNSAKATGCPRIGHGAFFAHECNILRAKELRGTHCEHSMSTRLGASKKGPSFVCIDVSKSSTDIHSLRPCDKLCNLNSGSNLAAHNDPGATG